MTKLYIFDCDGFILDGNGGLFIKGRRRLSFTSTSHEVSMNVSALVEAKSAFHADELPNNVIDTLRREGLLYEYTENFKNYTAAKRGVHSFFRQMIQAAQGWMPTQLLLINLVLCFSFLRRSYQIFSVHVTTKIVRIWGPLTNNWMLILFSVICIIWIVSTEGSHLINSVQWSTLSILEKILCAFTLLGAIIFHELAHASAAYYRLGACGAIQLTTFYGVPYLYTGVAQVNSLDKLNKMAISASGCILQVSISIALIEGLGEYKALVAAGQLSIALAFMNLLPFFKLDGYWILSELVGTRLRIVMPNRGEKIENILYSIFVFIVVSMLMLGASSITSHAQEMPENKTGEVVISSTRNPVDKSYRKMILGMDFFEKNHSLAPAATLRYKLLRRLPDTNMDNIIMKVVGETLSIPVIIEADRTFTLSRNQLALDENASVSPNRRAGSLTWRTDIRTPGLPPNTRRLGDLRLECLVGLEVGLVSEGLPIVGKISDLMDKVIDRCKQKKGGYYFFADAPLFSVSLVFGERREVLSVDDLYANLSFISRSKFELSFLDCQSLIDSTYSMPLGDDRWPDDTLVVFEYMEDKPVQKVTQP